MEKKTNKQYKITHAEPSTVNEPIAHYQTANTTPINMLGMQRNTQFKNITSDSDYINLIRAGLPKAAMNNLMDQTGITGTEMAAIIHTSDRTLRRYDDNDKLGQEQSERILELARLYSKGSEVFDSLEYFKEWMNTALVPLGYKRPKDFLDTSLGIDLLMKELGRMEHGIFA
ncbi:MAG: DUF2384 domain-containing protein [Edaphocola sp.]